MTAADLASASLELALRGLAVFPLAVGSKVPTAGSHGVLDASIDPDIARARWDKNPSANIGVATGPQSGFWALDIDPRHDGDRSYQKLTSRYGPRPATVSVLTPNEGLHMWFDWPPGAEIRNSAGRVGPGIDVRGAGGYVIAPPSFLCGGSSYRWTTSSTEILPAPAWLINLALPPPPPPRRKSKPLTAAASCYVAAAITDELRRLEQAREGARNDQLNRSAFAVAGFVLCGTVPEDWARNELETYALAAGLRLPEIRRTIESAFKAAHPRELSR